jgi:hypothetical protein
MASAAILVWLQDRANAEKQRGQFDAYEIVVAFGESGTEGFTCDTIGELKARPPSKRSVSCAFMCRHRMFARIKPESAFVRPTLSWARWSYIRRYPPEPFLQARRGDCRPPHRRCIPFVAAVAKPAQALHNLRPIPLAQVATLFVAWLRYGAEGSERRRVRRDFTRL